MCKQTLKIGVDVGKDKLWAVFSGQKPRSFEHTPKGIVELYAWARQDNTTDILHFCMEATGVYSQSLAANLLQYTRTQVSIVNPAQIAAFAKAQLRRTKTDKIDSLVILAFAQSQNPAPWKPETLALQQLHTLVTQADALRTAASQWANRKHTQRFIPNLPHAVHQSTTAMLRSMERQLAKIEKAIAELCANDPPLQNQVDLLCTIPGVAQRSATRILAYGKSALTNYSSRSLIAHAGLAPRHHQSGTSVHRKSYIAKQGNKHLRHSLYMPALVGIVHNPIIKNYYQRLLENDKPKMLALVACMKKLLLISRAILITQKPFNPQLIHLT
jgi:transposase